VFELGDDEKAVVLPVELTDDVLRRVDDAILRCPVQAISRRG
jgi:ferredoxin